MSRPVFVSCDGGHSMYEVAAMQEGDWNGFVRPLFDRVNARRFAWSVDTQASGPNGEEGERVVIARDYFVFVPLDEPEQVRVVRPRDDGLYDFGDGIMWEVMP